MCNSLQLHFPAKLHNISIVFILVSMFTLNKIDNIFMVFTNTQNWKFWEQTLSYVKIK